jgi:hypothetical protein
VRERRLQLFERILGLDGPRVALVLQELVGQALVAEARDEMTQGDQTAQHLLDPFQASNRAHLVEGGDLFRVGLDAPLGNDVPQ